MSISFHQHSFRPRSSRYRSIDVVAALAAAVFTAVAQVPGGSVGGFAPALGPASGHVAPVQLAADNCEGPSGPSCDANSQPSGGTRPPVTS